jgi:protein-tyrosine phosphatase
VSPMPSAAHPPPERRLRLDGPVNFRDIGGYPAADGRSVRWGRVFRSDSLETLTPLDLARIDDLGIRLVCDLRRDEERLSGPSKVEGYGQVRIEHLPIGGIAAETKDMAGRMLRGEIPEVSAAMMAEVYLTILELHPDSFGAVVRHAADAASLPMVVHCTAGKDRTGVASALLLAALGVDEETVAADYELSNEFQARARVAVVRPQLDAAGIEFAKVEAYFMAPRAVIAATLNGLRERWGGVESYLTGPAGLTPETIDRLRVNLLD